MAASIHYCDGKLEYISIGIEDATKCCCDTESKCKNCCKNEQFKPTLSNHFVVKQNNTNRITFTTLQANLFPELVFNTNSIKGLVLTQLPFKNYKVPVYIKNCTYRL